MRMLIVGIGALGGTIAARAIGAGLPVMLAARNTDSAKALRISGLRVSGIGGSSKVSRWGAEVKSTRRRVRAEAS